MSSVAFLNNTAGFGGGAMHLSNTMPITPGEPFVNITVAYNSVSAFAAGANIYGGACYLVISSLACAVPNDCVPSCRWHLNKCCVGITCRQPPERLPVRLATCAGSNVSFVGSNFSHNAAAFHGAGIMCIFGLAYIADTVIADNTCALYVCSLASAVGLPPTPGCTTQWVQCWLLHCVTHVLVSYPAARGWAAAAPRHWRGQ
jgi:hypothetical protein